MLATLRPFASGKLVVVFGCGGDRDRAKRPVMGEIATRLADLTLVTDDNPRSEEPAAIRAEIVRGIPAEPEELGRSARRPPRRDRAGHGGARAADDLLLIAGKGHETGQTIKGVTHPFRRRRSGARARPEARDVSALWTSDEVARALSPVAMPAPFEANGVTFDSRAVAKGDLFFALTRRDHRRPRLRRPTRCRAAPRPPWCRARCRGAAAR